MKTTNDLKQKLIDYLDSGALERMSTADVLNYAQTLQALNNMERTEYMSLLYEKMINFSGLNAGVCAVTEEAKKDG